MTDATYIDGEDNLRGANKSADGKVDWSAWLNNRKQWLDGVRTNAGHSFSSAGQKLKNVDFERMSDKFESAALGLTANALTPMLTGMATMALVKAGLVALGAPVAIIGIGFAAWSMTRSFVKARNKYNEDCALAESKGEEIPSFGFKYWWPFALKGLSTAVFMSLGVIVVADWDISAAADIIPNPDNIDDALVDDVPEASLLNNEVEDVDLDANAVGAVDLDNGANVEPVQIDDAVSYNVEFGTNFELPENPTAVDRMAAMMPDDASPEVIEALEAARDGHVWGVHNLAYHLSFEHGGLDLDEAGKQLVLDLYAEAASEGHQISIDNLATLENMWGMEAEGFDTSVVALGDDAIIDGDGSYSTLDLNSREELHGDSMAHYGGVDDALTDNQPSVIDTYLASLEDDAPNPYDVIEVSALPPVQEPIVNMADAGGPIDLTVNLGASLADMPEGYVPAPAAFGIDDGVTYGSGSFLEEDAIVTASNPSDAFAASTVVENAIAITPSQTVSFFDHEGLIRIASRDGLDLSQDVAFEFIAPNGDSQYTLVTGAQASQILDSDNPGALLQAMVEDSTGRQWAELNAPQQQETQFASLNGGGGERTLTLN